MSKHIPDTAEANAGLTTGREASRRDHLPYDIRHMDDVEWETIRWPGETGKMLFHSRPERLSPVVAVEIDQAQVAVSPFPSVPGPLAGLALQTTPLRCLRQAHR